MKTKIIDFFSKNQYKLIILSVFITKDKFLKNLYATLKKKIIIHMKN